MTLKIKYYFTLFGLGISLSSLFCPIQAMEGHGAQDSAFNEWLRATGNLLVKNRLNYYGAKFGMWLDGDNLTYDEFFGTPQSNQSQQPSQQESSALQEQEKKKLNGDIAESGGKAASSSASNSVPEQKKATTKIVITLSISKASKTITTTRKKHSQVRVFRKLAV